MKPMPKQTKKKAICALFKFARQHGVTIKKVNVNECSVFCGYIRLPSLLETGKRISLSPSNRGFGINYRKQIFFYTAGAKDNGRYSCVTTILHELTHLLASREGPDSVRCRELDLWGWESKLAKQLGIHPYWTDTFDDYAVGGARTGEEVSLFCELSPFLKAQVVQGWIQRGVRYGNIIEGRPVSVRQPRRPNRPWPSSASASKRPSKPRTPSTPSANAERSRASSRTP
jgi:hypothetical protein